MKITVMTENAMTTFNMPENLEPDDTITILDGLVITGQQILDTLPTTC